MVFFLLLLLLRLSDHSLLPTLLTTGVDFVVVVVAVVVVDAGFGLYGCAIWSQFICRTYATFFSQAMNVFQGRVPNIRVGSKSHRGRPTRGKSWGIQEISRIIPSSHPYFQDQQHIHISSRSSNW